MTTGTRAAPTSVAELEELLSEPDDATIAAFRQVPGDLVVLGAGGKMGPTLARMALRAARAADGKEKRRRVIAVSRFASTDAADALSDAGIEVVRCDLLDLQAVHELPDAPNVVFMAGQKFGTTDAPTRTWMMNVVAPTYCAHKYTKSRIVAFSTGNVYPLVPVTSGGATEALEPKPIGEYATSCLGRERVFEFHSSAWKTPVAIMRLNYANDLRYGVLTDLARRLVSGEAIDLTMGHVNVIWQGDANRAALRMLPLAASPPVTLNVSGAETLSVRTLATRLATRLGVTAKFAGTESPDALLSNTYRFRKLLGEPSVSVDTLLDWVTDWVKSGRPLLDRPTHFEVRDGAF